MPDIKKQKPKNPVRDTDLLTLSAITSAREARMLDISMLRRMIDARGADEAARIAAECGYPDIVGKDVFGVEDALNARRGAVYAELAGTDAARAVLDVFRVKYDYHNVKTLVKSMGANEDATRILSACGRVAPGAITDAFITGDRGALPGRLAEAMSEGVSILSRTANPQLSDIASDKLCYAETLELAQRTGNVPLAGYAKLMIDSANLRTFVRSKRTGRPDGFLPGALIDGGNASISDILARGVTAIKTPELQAAISLAPEAISGKSLTAFERAIDNAPYRYVSEFRFAAFGVEKLMRYLIALDWEITSIRTVISGLMIGVAPETLHERVREFNV